MGVYSALMRILPILILIANASFSQIKVSEIPATQTIGKVAPMGIFCAELKVNVSGSDTTYTLYYRNLTYKSIIDIRHFSFSGQENTFDDFYNVLKSVCNSDKKDYKLQVTLGDNELLISHNSEAISSAANVYTKEGYFTITDKQVDKLFAK